MKRLLFDILKFLFPCILLFFSPMLSAVNDATGADDERNIKAAMLLKFPLFIYWPEQKQHATNDNLGICVLGSMEVIRALQEISSNNEQQYNFHMLAQIAELDERCNMLFIDRSKQASLTYILARTRNRPILTVSDIDNFADAGGIIQISNVRSRLKIEININAAIAANLKISSVLLNLSQ